MIALHASLPAQRRIALVVAVLFTVASLFVLAHPRSAVAWDELAFSSRSERDLIALTNRSRAAAGLKALKISSTLTSVARWRSKDMIKRDYFSHSIPGYGDVFKKLDSKGYCYKLAGENIGWNTYPDDVATAAIHDMFMDSSGHRKNILNKRWDVIGVGAYQGADGKKMWTVLFADKCGSAPKATPKPKSKPKPESTPRPKPRATPKPTPKPTPTPTPFPAPPSTEREEPDPNGGNGLGPGGNGNGNGQGDGNGDGGNSGNGPPPGQERRSGAGDTGLRVDGTDPPPGLVEAIVTDVAGAFFGS